MVSIQNNTDEVEELLKQIHGIGECELCGRPKFMKGGLFCDYPHRRFPDDFKNMFTESDGDNA